MSGSTTWPPCVCPAMVRDTQAGMPGKMSGLCVKAMTGAVSLTLASAAGMSDVAVHVSLIPAIHRGTPARSTRTASFSSTGMPARSSAPWTRGPLSQRSWFP
jgi:hypothetical protein